VTFHDEVHHSAETAAYNAYKTLFVWLGTIAPIESLEYMNSLDSLAEELGWLKEPWPGSEPQGETQ
jgi:hypothetical protein